MKRFFHILLLVSIVISFTNGCKKVTMRKLDGTWTVVSGTIKSTVKSGNNTSGFITTVTNLTYDGENLKGKATTNTGGSVEEIVIDYPLTITYEFDKSSGKFRITNDFTQITKYLDADGNGTPFYEQVPGSNPPQYAISSKILDLHVVTVTNTVEEGIFEITGGSADIKKNSEVVLRTTAEANTTVETFKYYHNGAEESASGKFNYDFFSQQYTPLKTGENNTTSTTGMNITQKILTVNELKKDNMIVAISYSRQYTSANNIQENTNDETWTMGK